jgi:hypothetical protein
MSNQTTIPLDGVKSLKLRILVNSRDGHAGVHAAGMWLEEGVNDVILSSDEGATGKPVLDADSGKVLPVYTLGIKLNQLYVLEGRRQLENMRWSEPRFELPDQNDSPKKPLPRAPQIVKKIEVLDRLMISDVDVWESDKRAQASAAAVVAANNGKPAPQGGPLKPTVQNTK